jgi:Fic family protein
MNIIKISTIDLLDKIKFEKEAKLKDALYHQTQIDFSYNSNKIEGNQLSKEQTKYIYETNTIAVTTEEATPIDDIIETINHFQCFDYMIDVAELELSENIIKEFHRLIKCNTTDNRKEWFNLGDYKAKPNMVGDSKTTPPSKVNGEMAKLIADYRMIEKVTFEDIVKFHYRFESIHPFQDGNGRVGRMIMFKECLKWNITPFIIDEKFKIFYYRGLKEFPLETGYLIDNCYSAQDEYTKLLNYFLDE